MSPTLDPCAAIPLWRKREIAGWAIVDIADYANLARFRWHLSGKDRMPIRFLNRPSEMVRPQSMHRYLMGDVARPMSIDHINGDRLDNRRGNLRICHINDNNLNRPKQSNNRSGFKGVYAAKGKWVAQLRYRGRKHYLGAFSTPQEAATVYEAACLRYHGAYARPA